MQTMLQAALDLALNYGFHLLPVKSPLLRGPNPGKTPLIKDWVNRATNDATTITHWWTQHPNANIGIATGRKSGIVVIDVDPGNGGESSLAMLRKQFPCIPEEPTAKSGSGGVHYYAAYPESFVVPNSVSSLGPGIDVRGDGGFIVAPPSLHHSGNLYKWID